MLTKSQIVSHLAARAGLQNRQVALFLETLVALAIAQCRTVDEFVIPGLGKAVKVDRKARAARDQNGRPILIPAKTSVKFRVDVGFRNAILSGQGEEIGGWNNGPKAARLLQKCPKCGVPVREDRLQCHLRLVHQLENVKTISEEMKGVSFGAGFGEDSSEDLQAPPQEGQVLVERLPFKLLPPGTWDIEDVITYYRRETDHLPARFAGRKLLMTWLEKLHSLGPTKCYVGTEMWLGYVVFEFSRFSGVVLDCPFEGNAIYVLSGDWKKMVSHTKPYLRKRFPQHCTKIVHKSEWLARVRAAL